MIDIVIILQLEGQINEPALYPILQSTLSNTDPTETQIQKKFAPMDSGPITHWVSH
jgi:hypothetical protein